MAWNTKISGTWRTITGGSVKVAGSWRTVDYAYVKVGGVWKEVFANFNAATGGTVTTVSNYNGTGETWKVHTFTSNGTLTITNAPKTFRYLVVGGGGGAGNRNANGWKAGNPGGFNNVTGATLSTGSYSITIGGGGAGGNYGQNSPPGSGGTTTFTSVSSAGGGGGGADGLATSPNPSGTSNIQGSNKTYTDYGSGGYHYAYNMSGWGSGGGSGLVVVAYRVG